MTAPFVGPPTEGEGCAFAEDVDSPFCSRPATVHLLVDSDWGVVALASCSLHSDIGRTAGRLLGEHAYAEACAGDDCWEPA